jgi:hypothetical protein
MLNRRIVQLSLLALSSGVIACSGDKPAADPGAEPGVVNADTYKRRQKAYADSVLRTATRPIDLAKKLGPKYEVGSTRLRDTVSMLANAASTGCVARGREKDPYIAGAATFWVNISPTGSDVVRVQEAKWTSPAGALIEDCLNTAARSWKFNATFGKPGAYLVQVDLK